MVKSSEIQRALLGYLSGNSDILIPNFFYGANECDVFRLTDAGMIYEYEIKISRSDYFADFKKKSFDGYKHELFEKVGGYCPNRFLFVTPKGMLKKEEVPKYAGLLEYDNGSISMVKNTKLLHSVKAGNDVYKSIAKTLSFKSAAQRNKIISIRNTDFDKEIAAMGREVEKVHKENQKYRTTNSYLTMLLRKNKISYAE